VDYQPKNASVSEQNYPSKIASVSEQKIASVSEQKIASVSEQKIASVSEQKIASKVSRITIA
jgi:hypothetical protein